MNNIPIGPYGTTEFIDNEMGLLTPFSHVPYAMLTYTDKMSFTERWLNSMLSWFDWIVRHIAHFPLQSRLAQKYFADFEPLPSIEELRKNISVVFANAHRSIIPPRPSMPSLVYIGGAHMKPPKPLPNDLQKFMDESKHGVIYFSLGTLLKSSKMPEEKLNIFLGDKNPSQ